MIIVPVAGASAERIASISSTRPRNSSTCRKEDEAFAAGDELVVRGGSAILAPDGAYLAAPLWDEEGILFADLDPARLYAAR